MDYSSLTYLVFFVGGGAVTALAAFSRRHRLLKLLLGWLLILGICGYLTKRGLYQLNESMKFSAKKSLVGGQEKVETRKGDLLNNHKKGEDNPAHSP